MNIRLFVAIGIVTLAIPTFGTEPAKEARPASVPTIDSHGRNYTLWAGCRKMDVAVEELSEDAKEIDLTGKRIDSIAESRLRAARLYDSDNSSEYLYINVHVVGRAVSIGLNYNRWIADIGYGLGSFVPLWTERKTGTHGSDDSYIMQAVSEMIDAFILAYLETNEQACDKPIDEAAQENLPVSTSITDEILSDIIHIAFAFGTSTTAAIVADQLPAESDNSSICTRIKQSIDKSFGDLIRQQFAGIETNAYVMASIVWSNSLSTVLLEQAEIKCDLLEDFYHAQKEE